MSKANDNQIQTEEKESKIQIVDVLDIYHKIMSPEKLDLCECQGYYCEELGVVVFLGTPGGTLILQEGIYPVAIIKVDEKTGEVTASMINRCDLRNGVNGLFVRKLRKYLPKPDVVHTPGKLLAALAHDERFGGELYGCWTKLQYCKAAEEEEADFIGDLESVNSDRQL